MELHQRFLRLAKQGPIDLLFLGDSITQAWSGGYGQGQGPREVWDRYYGPRRAANFGIGGDRTQHVLWRLQNGEVDAISPKVVVLMIGTNNIGANTADEIAQGVSAIVKELRSRLPEAKILLLGILPRGEKPNSTRERVKEINEKIARLAEDKPVTYLDLGDKFLEPDGTILREVMPDHLHLSRKGYRIWAEAMEPTLWSLLDEPRS